MLKSLKIKNFRCFEEFDLPQLGRVNLLVGKNNSGKTSILEAVHILRSPNSMKPFLDILYYRGEYFWSEKDNRDSFDLRNLFMGHQINDESNFEISGIESEHKKEKFSFCSTRISLDEILKNIEKENEENNEIQIYNLGQKKSHENNYLLKWEGINNSIFIWYFPTNTPTDRTLLEQNNSRLVYLSSSNMSNVIAQFNDVVLTPQEDILYEALRIVEPGIERIAPISDQGYRGHGNGGFVVAINKQRVPIGSMGYGIWRMLEITLAMVNIPGGTLLIDEIDTGLHFSVMIDLWKLIYKTAKKLDIQVFATTHNSDCWKSLAEVANSDDIAIDDITIHRIERGKKQSIVFNEQEMAIAAERDIEVR
jgi:AAA15 family ATPase/GTPase